MKRTSMALFAALMAAAASAAGAPQGIEGEVREVKVSRDFGFDAADSTRFIQAALSSGAEKVVVDLQASDWIVMCLTGAPNQKVVFEKGVVVRAKPGAFRGRNDCLLSLIGCTNVVLSGYGATLKMERAAYDAPPYEKSEWRHVLSIRGGRNICVEGLTLAESGGDGVYVAPLVPAKGTSLPPENVVLKDVKCLRNYRQGASVISVKGLLCDNCDFSGTAGTPPAAGIDFEPNNPGEMLQDIVVRNCRFENNKGRRIEFYIGCLNSSSAPVTARFENCVSRGNAVGFAYMQHRRKFSDLPVGGKVELVGCTFERAQRSGVEILDKPGYSASISFRDCRIVDCCTVATNKPDVRLETRLWDTPRVGGVDFSGLEIRQPFPRPKFSDQGEDWLASGAVPARIDALRFENAEIVDPAPGKMRKIAAACPAGIIELTVAADRPRRVRLGMQLARVSARPLVPAVAELWKDGKRIAARLPKIAGKPVELSFEAKTPGFYTLKIDAKRHAVRVIEADAPVAVRIADRPRLFAARPGSVYFRTDAGSRFAFMAGQGSGNGGEVGLFAPSGEKVWECSPVANWARYDQANAPEGLWRAEVVNSSKKRPTVYLDVTGAEGSLFLSPDRYWKRRAGGSASAASDEDGEIVTADGASPRRTLDFSGCFPLDKIKTIALVMPASIQSKARFDSGKAALEAAGYRVKVMPRLDFKNVAPVEDRVADFEQAWMDPEVDLVLCARGGRGSEELLDKIDWAKLRKRPQRVLGSSNITMLLNAMLKEKAGRPFSGPLLSQFLYAKRPAFDWMAKAFAEDGPMADVKLRALRPGACSGPACGGHIALVLKGVQTGWAADAKGRIVFLETSVCDPSAARGILDELVSSGYFKECAGVVFGDMAAGGPNKTKRSGKAAKAAKAEMSRVKKAFAAKMSCPVYEGYPYGHVPVSYAIDFLREKTISADGVLRQ